MFRRRAMEEQLTRLSDRVTWLEAKLLEEREANDELTRHLIELREQAEQVPEPTGPSAEDLLAALQHVLDATASASTKAAAAMDERVDTLVTERIRAARAELQQGTGIASIESERQVRELREQNAALASELEGVRLRLAELSEALTRQFDELGHELDGLGARSREHEQLTAEQQQRLVEQGEELAEQRRQLEDQQQQAREHTDRLADHGRRVAELDQRLVAVAAAAVAVPDGAVDTATLDARAEELRANQARIANELVRFEVALRQEVARLAETVQQQSRGGPRR